MLTGEVGSGKTVAVRAAADGLDASRNTLIYLPNPQIGTRGIHGAVATALGQAPRFHHATLIPQVEAALAAEAGERNRHVILALDESHLLTHDQLEAVRMLTNSDLDSRSPLTILLIGQPTLRRRLRVGDLAALDQRIALRYHIPAPALTAAETGGYIRAHLSQAGPTRCSPGLSGVTKIKDGIAAGRALTYASVTGRAKAASTRGRSGMSSVVGCPRGGSSPDNPSATEGETGKPGPSPAVADARWRPRITDDAVRAIHAQARGLPRAINRLAITALLAAYAAGKTIVDESSARTAISEEATAATD